MQLNYIGYNLMYMECLGTWNLAQESTTPQHAVVLHDLPSAKKSGSAT